MRRRHRKRNVNISGGIQNAVGYGIIITMLTGVMAGAVAANLMDGYSNESVRSYITGFLGTFDKDGISAGASFIDSFYKYSRIIIIIWSAGFFAPAAVVAVCVFVFKAFAYGFTTALLVKYFGLYGLVVGFNSYIPQNIFFLPGMLFVTYGASLRLYYKLFEANAGTERRTALNSRYVMILLTGIFCCFAAALIEAYITPSLIEYITPV